MYGYDQCRMCGCPIMPKKAEWREVCEQALAHPIMPEKEWRRMGYLAPPARRMLSNPAMGCCTECGMIALRRRGRFGLRLTVMACVLALVCFGVGSFIFFLRH